MAVIPTYAPALSFLIVFALVVWALYPLARQLNFFREEPLPRVIFAILVLTASFLIGAIGLYSLALVFLFTAMVFTLFGLWMLWYFGEQNRYLHQKVGAIFSISLLLFVLVLLNPVFVFIINSFK